MTLIKPSFDPVTVVAAATGGYVVLYSLVSLFIKERLYLSETMMATLYGIAIGPVALNLLQLDEWGLGANRLMLPFTRLMIAVQVMVVGVCLPKAYLLKQWKSLFVLLFPVMIVKWFLGALAAYLIFPINWLEALMIGACIAPTDPVLANSIVRGKFAEKHVPLHVRNLISAESGANDGLGYPYIFFALLMLARTVRHQTVVMALSEWIYGVWLYQIALSTLLGFVIGHAFRLLLQKAEKHDLIDKESFLAFSFSLTFFIVGTVGLLGSDDLLAVFVAGNAFTWDDWFRVETENSHLQEVIDMLFTCTFFVYFGMTIPWKEFVSGQLSISSLCLLSFLVLVVRRLPVVVALTRFTPALETWREAVFAGWFGPIGVGAIFYCFEALEFIHEQEGPVVQGWLTHKFYPIIAWLVLSSVVVHGITVPLMKIGKAVKKPVMLTLKMSRQTTKDSHVGHSNPADNRINASNTPTFVEANLRPMSSDTLFNNSPNGTLGKLDQKVLDEEFVTLDLKNSSMTDMEKMV